MASDEDLAIDIPDYMGIRVTCGRAYWRAKVENFHKELIGKEAVVSDAITNPDLVFQDRDHRNRCIFIRHREGGMMIFAVVEYTLEAVGTEAVLMTVFLRRRLRRGDLLIFVRSKR